MNLHTLQPATPLRRVATLFIPLLVLAAFSTPAAAQRAAFLVNHQLNPLKSFVIASLSGSHPFFVDIDADGDQDCFVGEYTNGGASRFSKIYFFRNEGNSKNPVFKLVSGAANPLNKVSTNTLSIPYFADIDGDGDQDCFIGEGNTGAVVYYKNVGTATQPSFEKQSAAFNPLSMVRFSASGAASPAFGDVDGDGDQDCVVADQAGALNFYRNVGTATQPRFTHVTTGSDNPFAALARTGGLYNVSFYDWNKDGLLDLFINTAYYKNVGTKQSARFTAGSGEEDAPIIQGSATAKHTFTPLRFVNLHGEGTPELIQGTAKGGFIYQAVSASKAVQIADAATFSVSPNPATSVFTIRIPAAAAGIASTIKIMDMQGKVLSSQTTNSSTVKVGSALTAGIYMLQISQKDKVVFEKKIMKQ